METAGKLAAQLLTEIEAPSTKTAEMTTTSATGFDWGFKTLGDGQLETMLTGTVFYASAFKLSRVPFWLSMVGSSGVGKTHLARRLADYWNEHCGERFTSPSVAKPMQVQPAKLIPWREFVDQQKQRGFPSIEPLRKARLVVLDDIGSEYDPSGFAKAMLYDILDARLGKWTVITSNLGLAQLAAIDQRISSRLIRGENKLIELKGVKDFNLRQK